MGFNGIDWTRLDTTSWEDLIQALMVETHPGAVAMDGSGGDGGRDVEWVSASGERVFFDAKYFPSPLKRAQHRQVVRALESVAKQGRVDRWLLVVPRNHNPTEKAWFESLSLPPDCQREWLGETWVGKEVAKRPYLVRAYLKTQTEETLRLLAEYHAEGAALQGGVADLLQRQSRLAAIGDTLDPDYRIALSTDGSSTHATLVPRHDQAKPVQITISLTSAERPAEPSSHIELGTETPSDVTPDARLSTQLQALYDYGDPVLLAGHQAKVDVRLPVGGTISFGGPDGLTDRLQITGAEERADPGHLEVQTVRGKSVYRLPIVFTERRSGFRGGQLAGTDPGGSLSVTLSTKNAEAHPKCNLQYNNGAGLRPRDALPVVEFLSLLRPPHYLAIYWQNLRLGRTPMLAEETQHLPRDGAVQLVQALDDVDRYLEHCASYEEGASPLQRLVIPSEELPEQQVRMLLAIAKLVNSGSSVLPLWLKSFRLPEGDSVLTLLREEAQEQREVLIQGTGDLKLELGDQQVAIPDVAATHRVRVESIDAVASSEAQAEVVVHVRASEGTLATLGNDDVPENTPAHGPSGLEEAPGPAEAQS